MPGSLPMGEFRKRELFGPLPSGYIRKPEFDQFLLLYNLARSSCVRREILCHVSPPDSPSPLVYQTNRRYVHKIWCGAP